MSSFVQAVDPKRVRRITSDAQAIDVARELAAEFAVGASERDRQRRLPWDELQRWSESGLGGITIPRAYGGANVSYATLAEVFVILCAADPALGQIPQNHYGVLGILREAGTQAQKNRFYGEVLAGARLGNGGPEKRSDPSKTLLHTSTRVTQTANGLRLNGHRFYSTGALFAHRLPSRAVDEQGRAVQVWPRHDAQGLRVIDDWSSFGQRTTASGSVLFEDVPLSEDEVVQVWKLAEQPGLYGPNSQLIQAAIDQGIAQAAVEETIAFVRQYARPWVDSNLQNATDDPYIIQDIGRLQADLHAAHEVLLDTGRLFDAIAAQESISAEDSARASVAVAEAKVLTTQIALDASEKLFELAGSAATRTKHNLDRHWRNARVHTLHDPVRWKTHLIGNYHLNGVLPARHSWN